MRGSVRVNLCCSRFSVLGLAFCAEAELQPSSEVILYRSRPPAVVAKVEFSIYPAIFMQWVEAGNPKAFFETTVCRPMGFPHHSLPLNEKR